MRAVMTYSKTDNCRKRGNERCRPNPSITMNAVTTGEREM